MKKRDYPATFPVLCVAAALLLGLVCGSFSITADAVSSSEIQNQIEELENQQQKIEQQLAELEDKKSENLSEIQDIVSQKILIEQQIVLLNAQITGINEQIASYNVLIADQQERLENAQQNLAALNQKYKQRIRAMEEDGELSLWLVLFRANSFSDFLDRLNMIQEIAAADRRRLRQISDAAALVEASQQVLQDEKRGLQETRQDLTDTQTELDNKNAEVETLLARLLERKAEYEALIEESADRKNDILDELAQKEKEYNDAREEEEYQQWLSTSVPNDVLPDTKAPGGNFDTNGIYWVIPTQYRRVSSPFTDERLHPILGYVRPHRGIDLAANTGTPIYATRSGTVTTASTGKENGNYVFINHGDGYSSAYLHMHYYIVQAGEYVRAGQMIGVVGNTGLSKGSHLHFSIIHNGVYVNPALYVNFY